MKKILVLGLLGVFCFDNNVCDAIRGNARSRHRVEMANEQEQIGGTIEVQEGAKGEWKEVTVDALAGEIVKKGLFKKVVVSTVDGASLVKDKLNGVKANGLTAEETNQLLESLPQKIKVLELNNCKGDVSTGKILTEKMNTQLSILTNLTVANCHWITNDTCEAFFEAALNSKKLTTVNLDIPEVSKPCVAAFRVGFNDIKSKGTFSSGEKQKETALEKIRAALANVADRGDNEDAMTDDSRDQDRDMKETKEDKKKEDKKAKKEAKKRKKEGKKRK